MTIPALLITLIIGGAAGWLAGQIVKGDGNGLVMNVIIGILGAILAGWLFPMIGLGVGSAGSILGAIIYATVGAVILLFLLRLITRTS